MEDIKKGDRVRITIEGEVTAVSTNGDLIVDDYHEIATAAPTGGITVEKVEPPVEVFGPGDVVRHKTEKVLYTIGKNGFLNHRSGILWESTTFEPFTSEHYERVSLD